MSARPRATRTTPAHRSKPDRRAAAAAGEVAVVKAAPGRHRAGDGRGRRPRRKQRALDHSRSTGAAESAVASEVCLQASEAVEFEPSEAVTAPAMADLSLESAESTADEPSSDV